MSQASYGEIDVAAGSRMQTGINISWLTLFVYLPQALLVLQTEAVNGSEMESLHLNKICGLDLSRKRLLCRRAIYHS